MAQCRSLQLSIISIRENAENITVHLDPNKVQSSAKIHDPIAESAAAIADMERMQAEYFKEAKAVLEEIIAVPTENDFVTFEIKSVGPIAVTKKYAGVGASLVAKIKNTRTPFSIDIGVGDVIVPGQEKRKIPTQLEGFDAPVINTYSLETTIAEKLDAILNLMEFSSRMKDYYDIYYLANKFDFDGAVLTEALRKTFANRAHSFTVAQFEQILTFDNDDAMQKKWRAFCRKTDIKTDDYSTVLKTIKVFLEKPFAAAIESREFGDKWSTDNQAWE